MALIFNPFCKRSRVFKRVRDNYAIGSFLQLSNS